MSKVYFLSDQHIENYLDNPDRYKYIPGKHISTNYMYWIVKNAGAKNVDVVLDDSTLTNDEALIFHYDHRDRLLHGGYKRIQSVSDRPAVESADLYLGHNLSLFKPIRSRLLTEYYGVENMSRKWVTDKWTYTLFPLACNIKRCTPQWPPTNFKYVGRETTIPPSIYSESFVNKLRDTYGVNLIFDFDSDCNDGTEHAYFSLRNHVKFSPFAKGNNIDGILGHKTANRLYQTWFMNVPGIFETNSAMMAIRKSPLDYLVADTEEQLEQAIKNLVENETLYWDMIANGKKRERENTNELLIQQWNDAIRKVGVQFEF